MAYLILGLILVVGVIVYLVSCKSKGTTKNDSSLPEQHNQMTESVQREDNPFVGLRNLAFEATPEQLGLSLSTDKIIVYGVIMDWDLGEGIATIVSYLSGDASFYLSSGGGMIGGGQHPNVNASAKAFVQSAKSFLSKTTKTESTPLPDKNGINFYFLTTSGLFAGKEQMKNIENNSSPWLELFKEGNKVISELRLVSEKQ